MMNKPRQFAASLLPYWRLAVSVLVLSSLLLNVALVITLLGMKAELVAALESMRDAAVEAESRPLTLDVAVDREIPVQMTVPIDQTFDIPLDLTYPLNTVINTYITLPVLGRQNITLPVDTVLPISTTVAVPIRAEVPISLTYHLQTDLPVQVQFPLKLSEPLDMLIEGLK